MNENVNWLTTCPVSDLNFKNHLSIASIEEINEALSVVVTIKKGNASRVSALKRELLRREKNRN